MEYTKDMIFYVNYGQAEQKGKFQLIEKIIESVKKHKIMTMIIGMTVMLSFLDFVLLSSFINVLSSIE